MRAVQAAALELFEARGFEAVAVEEVAEAAGVSPSTLYRRFGTKERLVLWDESEARIDARLGEVLGELPPFQALREAFVGAYREVARDEVELHRRRGALVDAEPALASALAEELDVARRELAAALQAAYGRRLSRVAADLAARIALAAFVTGFEAWQRSWPSGLLHRDLARAFDAVPDVVAPAE